MMKFFVCVLLVAALALATPVDASPSFSAGLGPENVTQLYGYIDVHNKTRHMFYWMFESRSNPATDPFVLWMTGGPGCSSLLALFFENGPYKVDEQLNLHLNPYSWNSNATVIWVDQPVGTGFSYSSNGDVGVISEDEMAQDMYEFLQLFFSKNDKYLNNDFYIFGESYGGHYVPALSARIYRGNTKKEGLNINIKGSGIGNGLVDPYVQYGYYPLYAQDNHVLDAAAVGLMKAMTPVCLDLIKYCATNSTLGWAACINAYTICNMVDLTPIEFNGLNPYDIRENCTVQPLCYDFTAITKYLSQSSVKEALGVPVDRLWQQCNRLVDLKLVFAGDWMLNYADDVTLLLESGHRIIVYAGEDDYICNWYGNHAWPEALEWSGASAYHSAPNSTWSVAGSAAGEGKTANGLTFLKVYKAGHMVPYNQPKNALDMFTRFIFDLPVLDGDRENDGESVSVGGEGEGESNMAVN